MKRREFIRRAASGMGAAAWLGSGGLAEQSGFLASLGMTNGAELVAARLAALPALPRKFAANETVTIGKTGIQTSLLAMGTGTVGSGHHSHQTALGIKGLSAADTVRFSTRDSYVRMHPHEAGRVESHCRPRESNPLIPSAV